MDGVPPDGGDHGSVGAGIDSAALFFGYSSAGEEAKKLLDAAKAYKIEKEKRQEEREDAVVKYISRMKKEDLQQTLLALLFDGPEWQYDRFVREHIGECWS